MAVIPIRPTVSRAGSQVAEGASLARAYSRVRIPSGSPYSYRPQVARQRHRGPSEHRRGYLQCQHPMLPRRVNAVEPVPLPTWRPYSGEWKAVYNKRVSVERVFSRLKTFRKLNSIRTRRMPKVWLHVAMSLLTMTGAALTNTNNGAKLRRCVG